MINNNLCIVPIQLEENTDTYEVTRSNGKKATERLTTVNSVYRLMHSESWEYIDMPSLGKWIDTWDKWPWKAMTYALKYLLLYVFLVPTGDIDDADTQDSRQDTKIEKKKFDIDKIDDKVMKKYPTAEQLIKAAKEGGREIDKDMESMIVTLYESKK